MLFRCSPGYIEFDPPRSSIHSDNFAFDWNVYQPMRSKEWTKEINGTWGASSLLSSNHELLELGFGDDSWMCQRFCQLFLNRGFSRHFFCVYYSFWAFNLRVNYSSWAFNLWVNSFWAFASTCVWALNFCTFRSFRRTFYLWYPCFIYVGAPVSLHFFMILVRSPSVSGEFWIDEMSFELPAARFGWSHCRCKVATLSFPKG